VSVYRGGGIWGINGAGVGQSRGLVRWDDLVERQWQFVWAIEAAWNSSFVIRFFLFLCVEK